MTGRVSLGFLALASPLLLLCALIELPGGDLLYSLLAVAVPVALIAVGRGGSRALRRVLAVLFLVLGGSVAAMLALRGAVPDGPWIGALPAGLAILFAGVFLVPLVVVPWAYARDFDRHGLSERDLEALRRRFPRR